MVRNTAVGAIAFVTALSLTACANIPQSSVTAAITAAQNDAVAICKYEPTATTVASLFAAADPALSTAEAIATAICAAIGPAPTTSMKRLKLAPVNIDGVVITGKFVP